MSRWASISITAHYTGQVWVRERLPWAAFFDTLRGRALYRAAELIFAPARRAGLTTPPEFLVQRHRIMDLLLDKIAPRQLLELGAGLSPRALAFADRSRAPALDIDLPAMVDLKRRRVGPHAPSCYRALDIDLVETSDIAAALAPYLQRTPPTLVITEGLVSYFPLAIQRQIFGKIAALLRRLGGGIYLTDVHHQHAVDQLGPLADTFRALLGGLSRTRVAQMIADEAAGRALFAEVGFEALVVHDPAEYTGELALPSMPKSSGLAIYEAHIS